MTEENKANKMEGFDEPNGPFAKKKTEEDADFNPTAQDQAEADDAFGEAYADDAEAYAEHDARVENLDNSNALNDQLKEAKEQLLRAMAEVENTRKRAQRDREDSRKYAITNFAKDLIVVADNLRRALDSIPEDTSASSDHFINLKAGVEATERELLKSLEKNGIQKLSPLNEKFDPNFHEVMFEGPAPDKEPGTVIQVIEEGYIIHDRLLRPARVGVAKAEPQATETDKPTDNTGHSVDTQA